MYTWYMERKKYYQTIFFFLYFLWYSVKADQKLVKSNDLQYYWLTFYRVSEIQCICIFYTIQRKKWNKGKNIYKLSAFLLFIQGTSCQSWEILNRKSIDLHCSGLIQEHHLMIVKLIYILQYLKTDNFNEFLADRFVKVL